MLRCGECGKEFLGTPELQKHYHDCHHPLDSYLCVQKKCNRRLRDKNSLIRHIHSYHQDCLNETSSSVSLIQDCSSDQLACCSSCNQDDATQHDDDTPDNNSSPSSSSDSTTHPQISAQEQVDEAAVQVLIDLRSTASLTGKAVERFETGCTKMVQQYGSAMKAKLTTSLTGKGLSLEDIQDVLAAFEIQDPFRNLRSIEDQLKFFSTKFGLTVPVEKFLDHRTDMRLDPKTNSYVQTQVNESFQYLSIVSTLKAGLSNKKIREMILKGCKESEDGVIRSYVDGTHYQNHLFIKKHEFVIFILLFYDELEVANALGSKTIIHKLGAFFFQIINLPAELSSVLAAIHLLMLVNADDMKKEGAFKRVLTPLVHEMQKLSSDEGVQMDFEDGESVCVRAVLTFFTADTLAAHELLGLLGPGANKFCRRCMVSRSEVRADANAMGELRTRELHAYHLERVSRQKKFETQCGVRRKCHLDEVPYFHTVENNVFDAFHDLLEGIIPLVLKLVLRQYIIVNEFFTAKDLNARIASFPYGIPDSKNKPSPNFTNEMFTNNRTNIKQTGSQMWALFRALPFLVGQYLEEVDKHMELVFALQDIMQIIFSFEITTGDIDRLEDLIFKHNSMFFELFIRPQTVADDIEDSEEDADDVEETLEDEVEVEGEDEDATVAEEGGVEEEEEAVEEEAVEEEEAARGNKKKTAMKVYIINKLHHLKHYPDMIRQFGPPVRYWCARFEGRLKIFRQHSAICCNFKNTPKTMADMFQLSNLKSIRYEESDEVEHHQGDSVHVKYSFHYDLLRSADLSDDDVVIFTNSATVRSEDYRPGLFVCLPGSSFCRPKFALISEVVVASQKVILIVNPWRNDGRSGQYNSFQVRPEADSEPIAVEVSSLANFRAIAPWPAGQDEVHLSMRTVIV